MPIIGTFYSFERGSHFRKDDTLGAWMQRDPVGYAGGMNLYEYCASNSLGSIDPWGLQQDTSFVDKTADKLNEMQKAGLIPTPVQQQEKWAKELPEDPGVPHFYPPKIRKEITSLIDDIKKYPDTPTLGTKYAMLKALLDQEKQDYDSILHDETICVCLSMLKGIIDSGEGLAIGGSFQALDESLPSSPLPGTRAGPRPKKDPSPEPEPGTRSDRPGTRAGVCFVAGTQVLTDSGLKKIEELRPGDLVWSKDESTGEETCKRVEHTIITHPSELYHIRFAGAPLGQANETHAGQASPGELSELISSGEHPFWSITQHKWVLAKYLTINEQLGTSSGHAFIVSIWKESAELGETFTTYNVEVEGFHTYFVRPVTTSVRDCAIWVHNRGDIPCAQPSPPRPPRPAFPPAAEPWRDVMNDAFLGKRPLSDIPEGIRKLLVDYFKELVKFVRGSRMKDAQKLNADRANFLEGNGPPPGNLNK